MHPSVPKAPINDNLVRSARKKLGLQRQEMAELFNVAQSTVYRWERDQLAVPEAVLISLSFMLMVARDHWPPILAEYAREAA